MLGVPLIDGSPDGINEGKPVLIDGLDDGRPGREGFSLGFTEIDGCEEGKADMLGNMFVEGEPEGDDTEGKSLEELLRMEKGCDDGCAEIVENWLGCTVGLDVRDGCSKGTVDG